jgi:UMF1 family MFS transporter
MFTLANLRANRLSTGSFLPLTLEQLARERGTLQTSRLPCVGDQATANNGTQRVGNEQCLVGLLGLQINTASFAMYTFSLAVLVQALTLISFSALADYGMVAHLAKLTPPSVYTGS